MINAEVHMISKKLVLPLLVLGLLGSSVAHAKKNPTWLQKLIAEHPRIMLMAASTTGLGAGLLAGKNIRGSTPVKVLAGLATTAVITPLIIVSGLSYLLQDVDK